VTALTTLQCLNPHHPGWYWSAAVWNAYRKGDYRAALSAALKFNLPGLFHHHMYLAMVYGQLGEREAAKKALEGLISLRPDFALAARGYLGKSMDTELITQAIEGLRKAGLEIADEGEKEVSGKCHRPRDL
jgi:tetratricopeptide (TPR) repeat protein